MKLKITIKDRLYFATLNKNTTAEAFRNLLPLSTKMSELNSNEYYGQLPTSLPTNEIKPESIRAGDIMPYGNRVLCYFTKLFPLPILYQNRDDRQY